MRAPIAWRRSCCKTVTVERTAMPDATTGPVEGRLASWIEGCGCPGFGTKGQRLVRERPWFVASVIAVNLGVLAYAGYPQKRLAVLLGQ